MNSDLLTNIDYESFYSEFLEQDADLIIATVSYEVNIPYAVLETEGKVIRVEGGKAVLHLKSIGLNLVAKIPVQSLKVNNK